MNEQHESTDLPPLPSAAGPLGDDFRRSMKRLRRFCRVLLIILGALTFLTALAWVVLEVEGSRRLSAAFEYAESLGIPRTKPAPASQTGKALQAARDFERAARISSGAEFRDSLAELPETRLYEPVHPGEIMTADDMARAARLCESYREVFGLVRSAAEGAREERVAVSFNRIGVTEMIRALATAPLVRADSGDADGALDLVSDGVALIGTDEGELSIGGQSSRRDVAAVILPRGLSYVLWRSSPSAGALKRLQDELVKAAGSLPVETEVLDIYYVQIEDYRTVVQEPMKLVGQRPEFLEAAAVHVGLFLAHGFIKLDEARFIREAAGLIAVAMNPSPADLGSAVRRCQFGGLSNWPLGGQDALRWISNTVVTSSITRAELLSAAVAVAAVRYKTNNGEWPASIDALVPDYIDAVPTDPFSGGPLVYRQVYTGTELVVVVYSVGPNGTDDGGLSLYSTGGVLARQTYGPWGLRVGASDEVGFVIWEKGASEEEESSPQAPFAPQTAE